MSMLYTASQASLKKTLLEAIYTENHAMISQALTKTQFTKPNSEVPETKISFTEKVRLNIFIWSLIAFILVPLRFYFM